MAEYEDSVSITMLCHRSPPNSCLLDGWARKEGAHQDAALAFLRTAVHFLQALQGQKSITTIHRALPAQNRTRVLCVSPTCSNIVEPRTLAQRCARCSFGSLELQFVRHM